MTSEKPSDDAGSSSDSRPRRRRRRRKASGPSTSSSSSSSGSRPSETGAPPPSERPAPERKDSGRRDSGGGGRSRSRSRSGGRGKERGTDRDQGPPPPPAGTPPDDLPSTAFEAFDLPKPVLQAVAIAGYEDMTQVQRELIPLALAGKDVVARSRTGTGKTCAFLVPALAQFGDQEGPPRVLVVVPTRELAVQVAGEADKLSRYLPARTACVYGGTRLQSQFREIPQSVIVVGTPGRLLDHIGRGTFDTRTIELLVLDEVDRMYDLGFRDDVDKLIRATRNRHQTILVSATLNDDVEDLISKHIGDHERVEIQSKTMTVDEVEQTFYVIPHDRKRELLLAVLEKEKPSRAIIFVRTRFTCDRVAYVLKQKGFDAHEIHSGLPQHRREKTLGRFRDGSLNLLVATDVAARGLDIQGVSTVVNYDVPENAEDYVHRVGRTARMGESGFAYTFVTPDDGSYLTQIEKLINKEIRQERFPGFEIESSRADPAEAKKEPERYPGLPRWAKPARRRR